MKLWESGFSCGDFDHLYLNFTTCPVEGEIAPSPRSVDKYHSWYRYYDVEVPQRVWEQADSVQTEEQFLVLTENVLTQFFARPEFDAEKIHQCVREAISQDDFNNQAKWAPAVLRQTVEPARTGRRRIWQATGCRIQCSPVCWPCRFSRPVRTRRL